MLGPFSLSVLSVQCAATKMTSCQGHAGDDIISVSGSQGWDVSCHHVSIESVIFVILLHGMIVWFLIHYYTLAVDIYIQ